MPHTDFYTQEEGIFFFETGRQTYQKLVKNENLRKQWTFGPNIIFFHVIFSEIKETYKRVAQNNITCTIKRKSNLLRFKKI